MTYALISGQLFRKPEQRTSKNGKPFVTATIRARVGEASQWWKVLAFSETAIADLIRLTDGDTLSVQGALKAETYQMDSDTRLSLSIVADHVLALRQPPKPRRQGAAAAADGAAARHDANARRWRAVMVTPPIAPSLRERAPV